MKTLQFLLPPVLLAVLILGLAHMHFTAHLQTELKEAQSGLNALCEQKGRGLEDALAQLSTAPGIVASWVRVEHQELSGFEALADAVAKAFPMVEGMGLAKDGVISSVYPRRGHFNALGKDLMDAPEWGMGNAASAVSGAVLVAGPFQRSDGRMGFSSRVPVFLGQAGEERFWGFATAVTSLGKLASVGRLDDLARQGFEYRLESAAGLVLLGVGSGGALPEDSQSGELWASVPVKVPGLTLFLVVVRPAPEPLLATFWAGYGVAAALALMASALLYAFLRSPQRMRELAARRTLKLRQVNKRLAAEIRRGRQAAWDLEASTELSRGLFEDSPAIKLLVDPDTLCVRDVNPAASRFYGWPRQEMAGMPLGSLNTYPLEKIRKDVDQAMSGAFLPFPARHRLASGEVREVEIFSGPVRQEGRVLLQSVIQDVSEREKSRRELRKNQERLEAIVNSANWGIAELDGEGRVLFVNQPMGPLFGLEPKEFLGRPYHDFLHPDEREAAVKLSRKVAEASVDRFCIQARHVRTDGSTFWGNVSVGPLRDASGELTGAVSVITDVTELLEAKRAAEDASRAKSRFLANVSHEIRSPMNAIMGLTELTLRSSLDDRQRDYLEKALAASRSLLKVIEAILDYSRLDSDRLELSREPFSAGELLERLSGRFAPQAADKGLEFQIVRRGELSEQVLGDAVRLEQVLANLVENAMAFTRAGSVTVEAVRAPQAEPGWASLLFRVADTGVGIARADLERLFQPFTQADSELTRAVGGAGLGLSIAKKLVENMRGALEVESVPGQGTCFRFSVDLPLAGPRAQTPVSSQGFQDLEELIDGLAGMRVLVVDDNELGRYTALEMLLQAGLEASSADSGPHALARLAQERFDAVLLDIQMPGMDGFETFAAIRRLPGCARLPVIALTGHATQEDRVRSLEAGMDDHLGKPLDSSSLFAALRQHWRGKSGTDSSPALDTSRALALLMGNKDFYARLLGGFVREYSECVSIVRLLLDEGKTEDAAMFAHSVKGLAANLGGDILAAAALELEESLLEGGEHRKMRAFEGFAASLAEFIGLARAEAARMGRPV